MQLRAILTLLISAAAFGATAQTGLNDNAYRSSGNKYYWKNRTPDAAYWQQDVAYKISAVIDEEDHHIDGKEELAYWNNSPDTLRYVYFHLYQNAFVKGSYLHDLEEVNNVNAHMGKKEGAGLGTTTDNITVDGKAAATELDNTILKVYLPTPLAPGAKAVIAMQFRTYWDVGTTRRRMKMYDAWGSMHYNGVQWFPKLSVYDRMHGWDTYQHLNKEFYGDFGLYDVTLDFPSNYVVEATGVLQNKQDVLPDDLRKKLDIKNFAAKKWNEAPSVITPYTKGERKAWHYVASNVHDFAFTADPSYRIGTANWNGVECVALVQEPHAAGWQNAPDYIAKIIKTFSEDIGMYCYPKIVAADAADGMEYPMLTLDGGAEPGYRGLLIHEIGHNWFYGQVGSNETYRAAMDEGFTQFLTAWGLRRIDGDTMVMGKPRSKYRRRHAEPMLVLDRNVLNRYDYDALNHNEVSINTHSDDFNSALNHGGGYGQVYYKTATMLYNLQYVLGDSLFAAAMHHYFEQWKFAHPYFEDFRASVIQFTHVDLSWFFDEWFETTKTLDYGISGIHKGSGKDNYEINFHRKGEMQMPIDFTVTAKDGARYSYHIPNTWFHKDTRANVLPKWYGWGKLNPYYTAEVNVPGGIRNVTIDTTYRFADKDMVDNYRRKGLGISAGTRLSADWGLSAQMDRRSYRLYARPDLWWNPVDGAKVGLHVEGDYLYSLYKIDATVWYNTHLLQYTRYQPLESEGYYDRYAPVNYTVNYISPLTRNLPKLQLQLNSRFIDGRWYHRAGLNWLVTDNNTISGYAQSLWRSNSYSNDYLTDPGDWSSNTDNKNTSLNLAWTHTYGYLHGNGRYTFSLRAPMMASNKQANNDYSYVQLESVNSNYIGKIEVRTRLFGRYGTGTALPGESLLYMAGGSPEDMMDNKYTRSIGFVPDDWQGISRYDVNHFQYGGGLNLRGYAGYNAPDERNGYLMEGYKGRSGVAANVEVGLEQLMPLRPKFTRNWLHMNVYGFADAGLMELSNYTNQNIYAISPTTMWSNVHVDAGLGFAFTVKNWGVFEKAKPLTLRVDLPVFINRPPYSNSDYFTFRYVVGINRAF